MNKKIFFSLTVITLIGLFFHFYKINQMPPCLNADELAFSYNSYSLLKTGKDEFGKILPLRLISFGDYKLPLLSYLNIPLVSLFGLEKTTSLKLINAFILIFYPFVLYLFVKELFGNVKVAILSSFLFSLSLIIHSFSRQIHEALVTSFLLSISSHLFILAQKKRQIIIETAFNFFLLLSLFAYHSARIFALFFFFYQIFLLIRKKISLRFVSITFLIIFCFSLTDIINKPTRLNNLLFFNNKGFVYKIEEMRRNGGSKVIYNKITIGLKEIISEYFKYFSPQFLMIEGDQNRRFGDPNFSPLTVFEYVFLFIGLYYLFSQREKHRFFITGLLFVSPLSGSLSWAGLSVSRSFFIFIISLIIVSFAWIKFWEKRNHWWDNWIKFGLIVGFFFFTLLNWDYYLNQYPKKWLNQQAWQCGYKELVFYVNKNYSRFDQFYITKEGGPPYIFFLYYLKYEPKKFQKQAFLGEIDQYGFRQVEKFDKFIFDLTYPKNKKNIVVIGRPYEIPEDKVKKIVFGDQEVFWIKEIR